MGRKPTTLPKHGAKTRWGFGLVRFPKLAFRYLDKIKCFFLPNFSILMYFQGNLIHMFLIHLLLSHQNVGFKEAFDVQLAFCFFYGGERKSRFFSCKLPSLGKAGDDPVPQIPKNGGSSAQGATSGTQTGIRIHAPPTPKHTR